VLFQQAMAAYVQGDYENAGAVLEDALRVEPDSMDVHFYLGICRIVNGHPAEAVVPLKKVLTGPTSSLTQSAHFYLAKAYVQMQKLDGAEDEMRAAAHMAGRLSSAAQALVPRIQNLRTALAQRQVKPSD
jgi:Tfp pilus assembly protein PilF